MVSFDISIYSLNIVQFVVRTRSNKNHKMRHSRKKNCGLESFSHNPWIFKIFTHNGYCFYFSTELAKFPNNAINLGYFPMFLGTKWSNPLYNFWNSSIPCTRYLSLLLGSQLFIFPMGHAAGWGTFFHSLRFETWSFFEVLDSFLKTLQKKQKTKKKKKKKKKDKR